MLNCPLATDIRNRLEIDTAWSLALAVSIYEQRLDYGTGRTPARAEALAYLRRKTMWTEAIAAGALDNAILIRDTRAALEATVPMEAPLL